MLDPILRTWVMMESRIWAVLSVLAILVLLAFASQAQPAQKSVSLTAYVDVSSNGNASVRLVIQSTGKSSFQITLPRFQAVYLCEGASSVRYRIMNESSSAYFYYNSTIFIEEDSPSSLALCYPFPYAVLMADSRGWFMSPLLWTSLDEVYVYVHLPMAKRITYESPVSYARKDGYRVYVLSSRTIQDVGSRVVVEFDLRESIKEATLQENLGAGTITVRYPLFYQGIAASTLKIASQSVQRLNSLTGLIPKNTTFIFYLPEKRMGGISALGFVLGEDINAGGKGPVNLNLALIRYAPGYLETTIIHELVHVYLGLAGVEANEETRWFHEGMAQYVSIKVAEELGLNVTEYKRDLCNASVKLYEYTGGNFGFIQNWPSDEAKQAEAYLASFFIIANISDSRGGLAFISKVFAELERHPVSSTNDIVDALCRASGENLAPFFRKLGFKGVNDWSPQKSMPSGNQATLPNFMSLLVALLLSLLIFLTVYYGNLELSRKLRMRA
jgi:hypothetical protein